MKGSLTLFVFVALSASGQSDVWKALQQKFPGEPAVYVERSEVLNIVLEGDSIRAWGDLTQDMLHLKEQSGVYADKRIYGSSFTEIADIKAKTLVWDRSRYKEMNVTSFKKNDSRADGIFYDDSYYYTFNFPSVASQNRTLLQYRENIKDIRFISGYLMQSNLPHALSSYTIRASKGIDVSYKVLNDRDNKIKFQKSEKGGFVYYQWTAKDLPAIDFDSDSPSLTYFAPYIECHVKSYTTKKGTVRVLSDLSDLHNWYQSFIKDLEKTTSPALLSVVEEIKRKSPNELEIVKNVFYWVQENIKYIAFEQGMRGLIPHPASYVCEKRYGDCKDMANLIVSMLHLAGVTNAYPTWIGTRDLPYKYTEFPTPIVDNHMIATYVSPAGEYIFLDGTGNHTRVGLPSSMIQGKETFISVGKDKYEVKVVPEVSAVQNMVLDRTSLTLEGVKLVGNGIASYQGYAKVFSGYDLDRASNDEVKNAVVKFVTKGNNKFNLLKYEVSDLHNRDLPTTIKYDFSIPDYVHMVGNEIYLNLNLSKERANTLLPPERKSPLEIEYKHTDEELIEFTIPEGLEVDYIPENISWKNDLFSFEIKYTKRDSVIEYQRSITVNSLMINLNQFDAWNEGNRRLAAAFKESIVLKKK